MIPFIRSHPELMALTESRDKKKDLRGINGNNISTIDSGQRKRYIRSLSKNEVILPDIPKKIRYKWMKNKEFLSKFIDKLDYNNQIQSSYDLTLLEMQNKKNQREIA
tara:strand:- start:421 stop:741 length:321 start_codon:yes stop_codon:yes gene_type:complete